MDNKILETRLLLRESTIGGAVGSSVTRCAQKLQGVLIALAESDSSEKVQPVCNALQREILLYRLDAKKVNHVLKSFDAQVESYNLLEHKIQSDILAARESIRSLECNLKQQKRVREHREGLESRAVEVNALPYRRILKRRIEEAEQELVKSNEALVAADIRLLQRQEQFQALLKCLDDLQSKLPIDEEEQRQLLLQQQIQQQQQQQEENEAEEGNNNDNDNVDGRRGSRHSETPVPIPTSEEAVEGEEDDAEEGAEEGEGEGEVDDSIEMHEEVVVEEV